MSRNKFALILILLSLCYGSIFTTFNILKYKSFFSFEWEDDAAENQVVYNIANNFYPHQTIFISKYFYGHFTPIYFIIALFYKIYSSIYTWYFIMSFSYGFCSLIVFLLAKDVLKNEKIAFILSLAYLFYAPLHFVNLGTLDGNTFSLPLLFLTFYFMHKKKFIPYLIFMVLSCMCKEDIPLIIFTLGLYQLIKRYPKKWWLGTVVFAIGYLLLVMSLEPLFRLAHHFPPDAQKGYFRYLDFRTFKEIAKFFIIRPQSFYSYFSSIGIWRSFFLLLWPVLFLPIFSYEFYLAWPFVFEVFLRGISTNDISYYFVSFIVFSFIGIIFLLNRLKLYFKEKIIILAIVVLISSFSSNFFRNFLGEIPLDVVGKLEYVFDNRLLNVSNIFDRRLYTMDREDKTAWKFIKMIPKDASVTVSGDLLPALSCRRVLYELGLNVKGALEAPYIDKRRFKYQPYAVDYILLHKRNICNGFGGKYTYLTPVLLDREINKIKGKGFRIEKESGEFILFIKK